MLPLSLRLFAKRTEFCVPICSCLGAQITDVTKRPEAKSFMSRQNAETCSEIREEWWETKSEAAKPKPAAADVETLYVESFYCISNAEIPSLPFYVGIKSLARLQQQRLINT